MNIESNIKLKSFVKYSFLLGAIIAVVVILGNMSSISERHEQLIEHKINDNEEVIRVIGEYESFRVKKFLNYSGTRDEKPYLKYLLRVTGDKGSAYASVIITSPNTNMEEITVGLYDN